MFDSKTFTMTDILLISNLIYFPSLKSFIFNVDLCSVRVFMFVIFCHIILINVCK